jgi:hypothetical protein
MSTSCESRAWAAAPGPEARSLFANAALAPASIGAERASDHSREEVLQVIDFYAHWILELTKLPQGTKHLYLADRNRDTTSGSSVNDIQPQALDRVFACTLLPVGHSVASTEDATAVRGIPLQFHLEHALEANASNLRMARARGMHMRTCNDCSLLHSWRKTRRNRALIRIGLFVFFALSNTRRWCVHIGDARWARLTIDQRLSSLSVLP